MCGMSLAIAIQSALMVSPCTRRIFRPDRFFEALYPSVREFERYLSFVREQLNDSCEELTGVEVDDIAVQPIDAVVPVGKPLKKRVL